MPGFHIRFLLLTNLNVVCLTDENIKKNKVRLFLIS